MPSVRSQRVGAVSLPAIDREHDRFDRHEKRKRTARIARSPAPLHRAVASPDGQGGHQRKRSVSWIAVMVSSFSTPGRGWFS
jgi:hypothetical protein